MVERVFILDSGVARLDAATARRQFSLSLAVGFAVLAAAAIIELQPAARSTLTGAEAHHHADYALAATSVRRN